MRTRNFNMKTMAAALLLVPLLIIACGDSNGDPSPGLSRTEVEEVVRAELEQAPPPAEPGLSRTEVEEVVRSAISEMPRPTAGLTRTDVEEAIREALAAAPQPEQGVPLPEVERIARNAVASIPSRSASAEYTKFFVDNAISRYESDGLDATLSYYNNKESVDGQWYVFILDEDGTTLAHAIDPSLVGKHVSQTPGPNAYPTGPAVAASADEDGAWFDYTYPNPASGAVETKHSWMVVHDGLTFGSGWYEPGPAKSDAPGYTKAFVRQAMNLYDALGLEETRSYYNTKESVDDQWYVFILDGDGYTIAHHNPMFRGKDPSLHVDATGYFYGDDLLGATESGRWTDVLLNPEAGDDRQKHVWAVRHDGLIFASGWYE